MKKILVGALTLVAASSFANIITFDDGAVGEGDVLSTQYAGVTFTGGNTTGANIPLTGDSGATSWATNMGMHITSTDIGGGSGAPLSGFLLQSFTDYLNWDGDSIFTINFTDNISAISIDFGGIADVDSTRIFAISGNSIVAQTSATGTSSIQTLSLSGLNVNTIVVTAGDYLDWVGVDNINYTTTVPEPASMAALGLGALALIRRRKAAKK